MPWGDCTGPWWAQGNDGFGRGFRRGFGWFRGPWFFSMDRKAYLEQRKQALEAELEAIKRELSQL